MKKFVTGHISYEKGETPKQFGLAIKDERGRLKFMIEYPFWMGWSTDYACTWANPPTHYMKEHKGSFIINFRKKTSSVKLKKKIDKCNYELEKK